MLLTLFLPLLNLETSVCRQISLDAAPSDDPGNSFLAWTLSIYTLFRSKVHAKTAWLRQTGKEVRALLDYYGGRGCIEVRTCLQTYGTSVYR